MSNAMEVLAPGSRLGRYEVIGRLAVGGMAEIYLARATGIEGFRKLVVIKRILPEHAGDRDFVKMFLDEARLAALLQHPNVAQVYDIGSQGGSYFFAMEYVHGESAQKILAASRYAQRELPLDQVVAMVIGVAAGLHHAHEKTDPDGSPLGIVHRDVSPSNLLVTFEGGVKIVDFGVAKAFERQAKTRAGTLKGKVAYMSPEQCRGEEIDRRSDVFSIGIVLYELTTGVRPYTGDSEFAILNHIVNREPAPPSAMKSDYPASLERIVMRALRRNREERYATAQELQVDLEDFAREQKLVVSPVALAKFMEQLFGKKRDAWGAISEPAEGSLDYVSISLVVDASAKPASNRARRKRQAAAGTRRRRLAVALLGLGLLTFGGALAYRGLRSDGAVPLGAAAAPVSAAAAVPPAAPAPPAAPDGPPPATPPPATPASETQPAPDRPTAARAKGKRSSKPKAKRPKRRRNGGHF